MGVGAWGQVFAAASESHWDALLRFAMSLGLNREEARDVLQNALLRGMKYFETFARSQLGLSDAAAAQIALSEQEALARRFRGWLFAVVRNATYDFHGAKGRRELLLDESEWEGIAERASGVVAPAAVLKEAPPPKSDVAWGPLADELFESAADDELLEGLQVLNERQKSILYLVAEDHTYAEVATILGVPIGTVMSGMSRALAKVKGQLTRKRGSDSG